MDEIVSAYQTDSSIILSYDQLTVIKKHLISAKPKSLEATELLNIFEVIYSNLVKLSGLTETRVQINDILSIWFLRICQLRKLAKVDVRLPTGIIEYLFQYIVDFFEQNSNPLFNSLNALLTKLLNYLRLEDDKQRVCESFVDRIMKLNITSKNLYYLIETLSKEIDSLYVLDKYPKFTQDCISMIWSNPLANAVSKSFVSVYQGLYDGDHDEEWLNYWFKLVEAGLNDTKSRENIQTYLLPLLFRVSPKSYPLFIKSLSLDLSNDNETDLLINILNIGKNILNIGPLNNELNELIPNDLLIKFLTHEHSRFRLNSLNLLIGASKSSLPIPHLAYKLIIDNNLIEIFLNDFEKIEIRNEFNSVFKSFLIRIKDSTYSLNKTLNKLQQKCINIDRQSEIKSLINDAEIFLGYLVNLLQNYLQIGSNYSQLLTSYNILSSLVELNFDNDNRSTKNSQLTRIPIEFEIFNLNIINLLVLNVLNNYEDIRDLSVNLLLECPSDKLIHFISMNEPELINNSVDILYDLRGRKSDGGSKMIEFMSVYYIRIIKDDAKLLYLINLLLNKLEDGLLVKDYKSDLIKEQRVHGFFTSLKFILLNLPSDFFSNNLNYWKQISPEIIEKIFKVWSFAKPILSNENYNEEEESFNNKLVLNFSWKVIKESNSLLNNLLIVNDNHRFISSELFLNCSDLIIDQLANVKHRGAFSSIYPSFISNCEICFKNAQLKNFPKIWLENNIKLIEQKTQFISRRSGGLPYLITGILTADKLINKNTNELIDYTFKELIRIANKPYDHKVNEKIDLPQVHAFNCIKQIFTDSSLTNESLKYLNLSLNLSLSNFDSINWSIKNCAVMLFTSLQQKLFGNKKIGDTLSKVSSRLFFNKFVGLKELLLINLNNCLVKNSNFEMVFPILTILSRLETNETDLILKEFEDLLIKSLDNKYWKIREMVAKALSSILLPNDLCGFAIKLINDCKIESFNQIHGSLLTILEILKRTKLYNLEVSKDFKISIFKNIDSFLINETIFNWSNAKVYIDILVILSEDEYSLPVSILNVLGNFLVQNILYDYKFNKVNGSRQLLLTSILSLLLGEYLKMKQFDNLVNLIKLSLLSNNLNIIQLDSIQFCIRNFKLFGNSFELIDELWNLINDSNCWNFVKSNALCLLSSLLRFHNNYQINDIEIKINLLYSFINNESTEDISTKSLECIGSLISKSSDTTKLRNFLDLCKSFYSESNSFYMRYSSIYSVISFLNLSEKRNKHFGEGVFILWNGLHDDDEYIRIISSECLSGLFKFNYVQNSTSIIKQFYVNLKKALEVDDVQDLVLQQFLQLNIGDNILESIKNNNDDSLFDIESLNSFKNQTEFTKEINRMLTQLNNDIRLSPAIIGTLKDKVIKDLILIIDFIKINEKDGIIGWTKDEYNFIPILKGIIDFKTVLTLINNDNELTAMYESFRLICGEYNISYILQEYL